MSYKDFSAQGYTLLRSAIPQQDRSLLFDALWQAFRKYYLSPQGITLSKPQEPFWDNPSFQNHVQRFRQKDPQAFSNFYDSLQTSAPLFALLSQTNIAQLAAKHCNCAASQLTMSGYMLRMDAPEDKRNSLNWHQEVSYYPQNQSGQFGLVLWAPMHDFSLDMGGLDIKPGSHLSQSHTSGLSSKPLFKKGQSIQYEVDAKELSKYPLKNIVAKAGDIVLMSMKLFHKSGFNSSSKMRFTAGVRFHQMMEEDFMPGRLVYAT